MQDFLAATARRLQLWIVGGTVPLRAGADGRVAAASLVYDADGRRVARYDKIHLFDVDMPGAQPRVTASRHTWRPGAQAAVIDTPVGRLGLSVCYDVRFPELYRHLSAAGAQLLSVPSAFTSAHRARALGDAAAGAGHRESLLCYRAGAVGLSPERARDLRRQHDRRLLGTDPAARAARPRLRGGRGGPGTPGGRARKLSRRSCTAPLPKEHRAHE